MGHLLASQPNEILAIDFTLLEPSRNGYENVLVITEVFSKIIVEVSTRDQRASTMAQVLISKWFLQVLASALGPRQELQEFTDSPALSFVRCCKIPYHPIPPGW